MNQDPFLRPDAAGYAAIFTDGTVHVLRDLGLDRWSVSAVARWMRVQPPTVLENFSRARLIQLVLFEFAERWLRWSAGAPFGSGLPARLPVTDEERHGVRVWAALTELARAELLSGREGPALTVARAHDDEAATMARTLASLLGRPVTRDEAMTTTALVAGLRTMLAAAEPLVEPAAAERLLLDHVAELRSRGAQT